MEENSIVVQRAFPRLPLDGSLDLTYRCNNTCRHCWLWLPIDSTQGRKELSFDEITRIVSEARKLGCQAWSISGGEPMVRPDFVEIFDYITNKAVSYNLNTNGTLITPKIAQLLTRKGRKMVALYGATAEVHDFVTRNPGSFDATMQGIAYLREAGAGFEVQIVPMRANFHQYPLMIELASSLSSYYRIGAPWLWLSADHSETRNREIISQRLAPIDVIALDEPDALSGTLPNVEEKDSSVVDPSYLAHQVDDRLFASCIAARRDFHIDPYGQMSFCYYIKDPNLRFDLRQGSFQQAWEEFIPSLADKVHGGQEYLENCGSCELRKDCRWCAVYGYLEHGRYSAKVDYLCQVATKARRYKQDWRKDHIRYFQIAGLTIQVSMDKPIKGATFDPKFKPFQVDGLGDDNLSLRHYSHIPAPSEYRLGQEVYHKSPWVIYRHKQAWIYLGASKDEYISTPQVLAIFDQEHNHGAIYRNNEKPFENMESLTGFPSDQIILARALAVRQGCYFHASGFVLDGQGLLFIGHSEAGKSTMIKMLRGQGEILCDDRIIVRHWPEGFRIHGTWSHGELPDVSPASAPLKAIFFLEKASENKIILITSNEERLSLLLSHIIRPLVTADWWEKMLDLIGQMSSEVPIYRLLFDKSGQVVYLLKQQCVEMEND